MALDRPTRIGLGGTAMFTLAGLSAPLLGWQVSAPVMVICAIVAGWGFWPLVHEHFPPREKLINYWNNHVKRQVALIALFILGIAAGGLYGIPNFAFWRGSPNTGPIIWNFDETASGHGYFLDMQKAEGREANIVGFGAIGKNITSDPIDDFQGYLRSDLTNETLPIYFMAADAGATHACTISVPTPPEDTLGIPAFSLFAIATHKKPLYVNVPYQDAIAATKFKNEFAPFTVVLKYDGKEYKRRFSREEVDQQLTLFEKASGPPTNPYVVRKNSAPPITSLPPLSPLIKPKDFSTPDDPDLTGTVLQK